MKTAAEYRRNYLAYAESMFRLFGGRDLDRGQAAVLIALWDGRDELDDDDMAELLSRFPASEPPRVPGLDFLAVEQDAKTIVAETVGGWDDDSRRCARCGAAFSPSYATHCVPCDGPMRVVSGGDEVRHGVGSSDRGSDGLYRRCLCGEEFIGRDLADLADKIMAHERRVQS